MSAPEAPKTAEAGTIIDPYIIAQLRASFHLYPSYSTESEVDTVENRREGRYDLSEAMFYMVPSNMGSAVGHFGPEAFVMGAPSQLAAHLIVPRDVKRRCQPKRLVPSPQNSTSSKAGSGSSLTTLVALECPAKRQYSFDSMSVLKNNIRPASVSQVERTWAKNPDGIFVTAGTFHTTDNSTPGKIYLVTNPRFNPRQSLTAEGSRKGCRLVRTDVLREPVNMCNMFFQCSNANCGKRVAAELTKGCARCGALSTTRYCSNTCQWNDVTHWKICGKEPLVYGNVLPRFDAQRAIRSKQTYAAPNIDAWRQQLAHATSPGTYTIFMEVDDICGEPYKWTYQVGFAPGWEANAFGFLTRLAIDMGHVFAVKLLFRWIKRQIKRKAPAAWSDETFFTHVRAIHAQLCAEFGTWWAKGESFFGIDNLICPGTLDAETARFMEKEGWRLIEQDIPGFVRPHGFFSAPAWPSFAPPYLAGLQGFGPHPFDVLSGMRVNPNFAKLFRPSRPPAATHPNINIIA
ncbi:hypothetical protein ABW20_dc0108945 [Dactylellina cionopaga]|nr:hypothetical protein ABW20_dc0108945 [Dactylellina cionopaga]